MRYNVPFNLEEPTMIRCILVLMIGSAASAVQAQDSPIRFDKQDGKLAISIAGKPFADYHFANEPRSFFANVRTPGGDKATRNYPVEKGDQADHPHHQGIFVTFGDLNGIDYWHGKGKSVTEGLTVESKGVAGFRARHRFLDKDEKTTLCTEDARYRIHVGEQGYVIDFESTFTAESDLRIGSKEEGGIAVRMATPLAVVNGGRMLDDEGRVNGKEIWGKKARWVDYSGKSGGRDLGILLMTHPDNPRPCWWHARDYGLFAANPFGPLGSKEGGLTLRKGQTLRLRFAVVVHGGKASRSFAPAVAYSEYVNRSK